MNTIRKNQSYQGAWDMIKAIEPANALKIFALIFLVVMYISICYKISGLRKEGSEMVTIETKTVAQETDNSIYFIITLAVPFVALTLLFYLSKQLKANSLARAEYFNKQVRESVSKQKMNIKETEHIRLLNELIEARKIHDHQNLEYIRLIENATTEAFHWREQANAISNKIQHCLTLDSETLDIAEAKLSNPPIRDIILDKFKRRLKGSEEPQKTNGKELPVKGLEIYNKSFTSSYNFSKD